MDGVDITQVNNLNKNCIPQVKYSLNGVDGSTPMEEVSLGDFKDGVSSLDSIVHDGDVYYINTGEGDGDLHWAIVEKVEGNTVTLIEQNWVSYSNGDYNVTANRQVTINSDNTTTKFYRLPSNLLHD